MMRPRRGYLLFAVVAACTSDPDNSRPLPTDLGACMDPPRGAKEHLFRPLDMFGALPSIPFRRYGMTVSDLDGDGLLDFVTSTSRSGAVIYHNLGVLRFEALESLSALDVQEIAAGDLDSDGDVDLLFMPFDGSPEI